MKLAQLHRVRSTEGGAKLARVGALELDALTVAREAGERLLGGGAVVSTGKRFPMYSPWRSGGGGRSLLGQGPTVSLHATRGSVTVCTALAPREQYREGRSIPPKAAHPFCGRVALSGVPTSSRVRGKVSGEVWS